MTGAQIQAALDEQRQHEKETGQCVGFADYIEGLRNGPSNLPLIAFFVGCNPPTATHQAKRIVRCGRFTRLADKPELVEARDSLLQFVHPFRPEKPLEGPLRLVLRFTYLWNKTASKKVRGGHGHKETKPDCSNLAKGLEDVLVRAGFMRDDNQVVALEVAKNYGDTPGISVEIHQL